MEMKLGRVLTRIVMIVAVFLGGTLMAGADVVPPTLRFTHVYGIAPGYANVILEVRTPRGEIAGSGAIDRNGIMPFIRVYGAEGSSPGFQTGEVLRLFVEGQEVSYWPQLRWRDDWDLHRITIGNLAGNMEASLMLKREGVVLSSTIPIDERNVWVVIEADGESVVVCYSGGGWGHLHIDVVNEICSLRGEGCIQFEAGNPYFVVVREGDYTEEYPQMGEIIAWWSGRPQTQVFLPIVCR